MFIYFFFHFITKLKAFLAFMSQAPITYTTVNHQFNSSQLYLEHLKNKHCRKPFRASWLKSTTFSLILSILEPSRGPDWTVRRAGFGPRAAS